MKRRLLTPLLLLGVFAVVPLSGTKQADGCCMPPANFPGGVGQSAQNGILIHRDGVEDLILQIAYEIEPGPNGELPEKLTWLIALPSEPLEDDGYALADPEVFSEVREIGRHLLVDYIREVPRAVPGTRSIDHAPEPTPEVELGRRVQIGPYDIQPIRGVGEHAFEGLNAWLGERGFPTESEEHMAWFTEHGFTFLAIEVTPGEGETTLSPGQPLPPLRVRFETEYPYYPLKYSSQQGDFELALTVLTDRAIDLGHSAAVLDAIGWINRPGSTEMAIRDIPYSVWKAPQMVRTGVLLESYRPNEHFNAVAGEVLGQRENWHFAVFNARPNPPDRPITAWTGDCYFTLVGQAPAPLATPSRTAVAE